MHFRLPVFAVLLLALPACSTEPKPSEFRPPAQRGWMSRILNPFANNDDAPRVKSGVVVSIEPEDVAPSLKAARQVGVRVLVSNNTRKLVSLNFPTSQRIEIIARSTEGKILYTYSTDRNFTQEVSVLTINPGERLEYSDAIPIRGWVADKPVFVSASVVGQIGLDGTITITPRP